MVLFWFLFFPLKLHIAEHPAGHLVLKWLIEQDEKMRESGKDGKLEIELYLTKLVLQSNQLSDLKQIAAFISLNILIFNIFNISSKVIASVLLLL